MSESLLASTCPRCGGGFECGANAGRCDCFGIRLTERQRAELAGRYSGCLCLRCLRELVGAPAPQPTMGAAKASG